MAYIGEIERLKLESGRSSIGLEDTILDAARKLQSSSLPNLAVTHSDTLIGTLSAEGIIDCVTQRHNTWTCQVFRHVTLQDGYGDALTSD
ncbi:MAG: hypothetical protein L0177_07305 [Chloroflexi bacterium]|nr:hypothetical protein [Chloroflexota bacterium]